MYGYQSCVLAQTKHLGWRTARGWTWTFQLAASHPGRDSTVGAVRTPVSTTVAPPPLSLQSVVTGSTSADRQNYCMFSRPCSQDGKASKTSPRVLGRIQPGYREQVIPKRLGFVSKILQWRSQYALSGYFHRSLRSHARQQYAYVVPAHFQQLPLRNLGITNGPRSNIQKAGRIRRRPPSAQYSYKPLHCTPNVRTASQPIVSQSWPCPMLIHLQYSIRSRSEPKCLPRQRNSNSQEGQHTKECHRPGDRTRSGPLTVRRNARIDEV